jgi:hypothetical protein
MSHILPSLDQQTRAAREDEGVEFMWHHIDTCLPGYLRDHHNRDGELLLGVYVDGNSTVKDVLSDLVNEFRDIAYDMGESRAGYDHDKAKAALMRLTDENADRAAKLFDSSLEIPDGHPDDIGESCQAWFLLTWEVPPSTT